MGEIRRLILYPEPFIHSLWPGVRTEGMIQGENSQRTRKHVSRDSTFGPSPFQKADSDPADLSLSEIRDCHFFLFFSTFNFIRIVYKLFESH